MKTINKHIDIFESEHEAMKQFDKTPAPCHLLFGAGSWFVDRSCTAITQWPEHYRLISEKTDGNEKKRKEELLKAIDLINQKNHEIQ